MLTFGKLAKKQTLDHVFPGPDCADPRCLDLCAEACDAALSLRLDPKEVLRKTIQRELHCLPANDGDSRACRFGYLPASDALVLSVRKKEERGEVVHIFRTGVNECKKCQALEGTRITPEIWADEEKMRSKGFWKQKNGEYLPHPNCRCGWDEEILKPKGEKSEAAKPRDVRKDSDKKKHQSCRESADTVSSSAHDKKTEVKNKTDSSGHPANKKTVTKYNKTRDSSFTGKEVEFYVKGSDKKFENYLGFGYEIDGFMSLVDLLEKNFEPHSIGLLRIIGHGGPASAEIGGPEQDNFQRFFGKLKDPMTIKAISTLKKMLSSHAILELRMCSVGAKGKGEDENGPEFAQKLANLLGCRVKVYLEPVNPYGWSNIKGGKGNIGRWAGYEIYAPQP